MKFADLVKAIRASSVNPWVQVAAPTPSGYLTLTLQKGSLIDELSSAFPDGRSTETHMALTPKGHLIHEN